MASSELRSRLVYAILEFLRDSIRDGTVRSDDQESMEVAMQCISESFSVDWNPDTPSTLSVKPTSLLNIFEVFVNTQNRVSSSAPGPSSSSKNDTQKLPTPSESSQQEADALKAAGNLLLSQKQFGAAVEKYTEAITLDPTNPVYYSNRAAAQSQLGAHEEAINDALKALEVDPGFVKAYSRLGHGYFCSSQYEKAVEAYEKGLELEPENETIRKSLATAKSKVSPTRDVSSRTPVGASDSSNPVDLPNLGGSGGMPDLASLMNNPMMAQMAQNLMANGGLERMMQNPMIQQMMSSLGGGGSGGGGRGGGGMPDLSQIMNNPAAREMAAKLMGGMGQSPGQGNNSDTPP